MSLLLLLEMWLQFERVDAGLASVAKRKNTNYYVPLNLNL